MYDESFRGDPGGTQRLRQTLHASGVYQRGKLGHSSLERMRPQLQQVVRPRRPTTGGSSSDTRRQHGRRQGKAESQRGFSADFSAVLPAGSARTIQRGEVHSSLPLAWPKSRLELISSRNVRALWCEAGRL
jgi:hypothetical protein